MTTLFGRYASEPFSGKVEVDEKGKPFYRSQERCSRCGGAGRSDKWMNTGYTCYDCGGSGEGAIVSVRLYTAEEKARLDATAAKREATRVAKAAAAEAERRAPYLAWAAKNAHILAQAREYGPPNLVERLKADADRSVISPDWIIDVCLSRGLANLARLDARAASTFLGEVGKRIDLDLVCERLLSYGDRFRPFYIAILRDRAGNRVVYKGSRPPLAEGDEGKFRATVKLHEERDGEKQTIVERLKSLDVPVEEAS